MATQIVRKTEEVGNGGVSTQVSPDQTRAGTGYQELDPDWVEVLAGPGFIEVETDLAGEFATPCEAAPESIDKNTGFFRGMANLFLKAGNKTAAYRLDHPNTRCSRFVSGAR